MQRRLTTPKDPDTCNLYKIMQLFAKPARMQEIHDLYVNGGAAYGHLKLELLEMLNDTFGRGQREETTVSGGSGDAAANSRQRS